MKTPTLKLTELKLQPVHLMFSYRDYILSLDILKTLEPLLQRFFVLDSCSHSGVRSTDTTEKNYNYVHHLIVKTSGLQLTIIDDSQLIDYDTEPLESPRNVPERGSVSTPSRGRAPDASRDSPQSGDNAKPPELKTSLPVPLLRLNFDETCELFANRTTKDMEVKVVVELQYYNPALAVWESVTSPWPVTVQTSMYQQLNNLCTYEILENHKRERAIEIVSPKKLELSVTKVFVDTLLKTKKEWKNKQRQGQRIQSQGKGQGRQGQNIGVEAEEDEWDRGKSPMKSRRLRNEKEHDDTNENLMFCPFIIRNDTGTSLEYWTTTMTTLESESKLGQSDGGEDEALVASTKTSTDAVVKYNQRQVLLKNRVEPLKMDIAQQAEQQQPQAQQEGRISFSNEYFSTKMLNVRLPAFDETVNNLPINKVGVYAVKPRVNLFYSVSYKGRPLFGFRTDWFL